MKKTPIASNKPVKRDYPSYLKEAIRLKPGTDVYKPVHFYLHSIIDHTNTYDSAGVLILPVSFNKQKISFAGKKDSLLFQYFNALIAKDTSLLPIRLEIEKLEIKEEKISAGLVKQEFDVRIRVCALINGEVIPLDMMGDTGHGESYIYSRRNYDSLLRRSFYALPPEIDLLAKNIRTSHPAFAKGVHVEVIVISATTDPDSIFFNAGTFLVREDYKRLQKDEEDLHSAFALYLDPQILGYENGFHKIQIRTGALFVRSRSWMGSKLKVSSTIQHESYKGLLVYLYSLKLKQKILETTLSAVNFREEIHLMYSNVYDELNEEIRKYDKETGYGTKSKIQTEWQARIDEAIASMKDH